MLVCSVVGFHSTQKKTNFAIGLSETQTKLSLAPPKSQLMKRADETRPALCENNFENLLQGAEVIRGHITPVCQLPRFGSTMKSG